MTPNELIETEIKINENIFNNDISLYDKYKDVFKPYRNQIYQEKKLGDINDEIDDEINNNYFMCSIIFNYFKNICFFF